MHRRPANAQNKQTSTNLELSPVASGATMVALSKNSPKVQTMPDNYTRPQSQVTEIRNRQRMGQDLNDDDKMFLRVHYAPYGKQKVGLHLQGDRKETWRAKAGLQGLSLSAWVQERVIESLSGPSEAEKSLRDDNGRLRDEVSGLRGTTGQLAVENSNLHARLEVLEVNLMETMERALQLREQIHAVE